MLSRHAAMIAAFALIVGTPAYGKDVLNMFEGTWGFVSPPEIAAKKVIFIETGLTRHASMPNPFGQVTFAQSGGDADSDFKMSGDISGLPYDCFYEFTKFDERNVGWNLKKGDRICYTNVLLRKDPQ
jgi:hypothetical protein